jgi:hypothetical protein
VPTVREYDSTHRNAYDKTRRRLQLRFVVEGEAEQAVAAAQLQFMGNVLAMGFDRVDTALEEIGDLFAGPVLGDPFEDLPFRGGQPGQATGGAGLRVPQSTGANLLAPEPR